MANKGSYLRTGETMDVDDYLVSEDERFYTTLEANGSLCTYQGSPGGISKRLWTSDSAPGGAHVWAAMMGDGEFCVLYSSSTGNGEVWSSRSRGSGGRFYAIMQNDGSLCVYKGSAPSGSSDELLWSSRAGDDVEQITVNNDDNSPNFKPSRFPPGGRTVAQGSMVSFKATGNKAIKFFAKQQNGKDAFGKSELYAPASKDKPTFYKLEDACVGTVTLISPGENMPPGVDLGSVGAGVNGTIEVAPVGQIIVNSNESGFNFNPPEFPPRKRKVPYRSTVSFQADSNQEITFFAQQKTGEDAFEEHVLCAPKSGDPPKFYKLKDTCVGTVTLWVPSKSPSAHVPPDDPASVGTGVGAGVNGTINVGGPGDPPK